MFNQINPYILNDVPELKVSYHPYYNISEKRVVFNSDIAQRLFTTMRNRDTICLNEEVLVAYLNHNYQVIGICHHSKGTAQSCSIDIRQLLGIGLKVNAYGIIIAHNHPEQTTQPSFQDTEVTMQLEKAATLCGMKLLDHVIISAEDSFYSFADDDVIGGYGIEL